MSDSQSGPESTQEIVILGGARTPMGEFIGPLKDFSAIDLGVIAARAALERTKVDPAWIDHVVFGNVMQTSGDALYGARHVGLKAGVPIEVPALTVNRLCGSGLQAAISGAQMIQLGEAGIALTGGMESMTQAPHVIRGMRTGLRMNHAKLEDTLWEALLDTHCGCSMAITAENCAAKYDISREAQDAYALRSQQLASRAWADGRLAEEVVPVDIVSRKGKTTFAQDDHLRPDTTLEGLAKLPAAFSKNGCVTAGNASGIVDGGAALVIASADAARARNLDAARPSRLVGHRRRRADADGHGTGAGDPRAAREDRADARATSISSRSTKRSPRNISRWRRTSASIARRST